MLEYISVVPVWALAEIRFVIQRNYTFDTV